MSKISYVLLLLIIAVSIFGVSSVAASDVSANMADVEYLDDVRDEDFFVVEDVDEDIDADGDIKVIEHVDEVQDIVDDKVSVSKKNCL